MARCWGITRNLHRCKRTGDWTFFCDEHQRQWIGWLFTLVSLIAAILGILGYFSVPQEASPTTTTVTNERITISGDVTTTEGTTIVSTGDVTIQQDPLAAQALKILEQQLAAANLQAQQHQDQIKALTESITALTQKQDQPGVKEALQRLAKGDTQKAETIFQEIIDRGEPNIQETAEAYRHLGALAFLHDTQKSNQCLPPGYPTRSRQCAGLESTRSSSPTYGTRDNWTMQKRPINAF